MAMELERTVAGLADMRAARELLRHASAYEFCEADGESTLARVGELLPRMIEWPSLMDALARETSRLRVLSPPHGGKGT